MNIHFTARHFHASPELQTRMEEDVKKLSKFYHKITDASIVLDAAHERQRIAEITLQISDKTISAKAEEENMAKAIDSVLAKVERQLKKENEKLKSHKAQPISNLVS